MFPLSTVAFNNKVQLLFQTGIRAAHNQPWHIILPSFNFSITVAEQTLFLWMLWILEMIPSDCLSIDFKFHEIQLISARLEYLYIETLQKQIVQAASSFWNTRSLCSYLVLPPVELVSLAPKWEKRHNVFTRVALYKQMLTKKSSNPPSKILPEYPTFITPWATGVRPLVLESKKVLRYNECTEPFLVLDKYLVK